MSLTPDQKALAFQFLEAIGEEVIKEWLENKANPPAVKPTDATDKINELTDSLEGNDATAEEELTKKFPPKKGEDHGS